MMKEEKLKRLWIRFKVHLLKSYFEMNGILQKVIPKIRDMVFPGSPQAKAPPLPGTPMPDKKLVASMPQINKQTGLTQTEAALLSPSEQVIARRT